MKKTTDIPKVSNYFATGPVKKVIDWQVNNNDINAPLSLLGRSHRSKSFLKFSQEVINKVKSLLNIPPDYKIVTITGGATAAMELALWTLLGPKPVDCLSWEFFGNLWYDTVVNQLKLSNVTLFNAEFGKYPSFDKVNFSTNDVVFVYSGSTSGVVFSDEDKIPINRQGLIISDATSYVFLNDVPWEKLDAVAFSWQKVLAGEAAHGMLVLSPRAIERLQNYTPPWGLPKLFRLKDNTGALLEEYFDRGICTNTPSILAFIDANCNLDWIAQNGGIAFLQERIKHNYRVIHNWVQQTQWIDFLVTEAAYRAQAIVCLVINDEHWNNLSLEQQKQANLYMRDFLEENKLAYDVAMYRLAPIVGFRIWLGPSITASEVVSLTHGLELAYANMKQKFYP